MAVGAIPTHTTGVESGAMTEPTTYEIVIRGKASERVLRPLLDDFAVDHPEQQRTRLTGVIADAAQLHGVLHHLTSVAAEVISVMPSQSVAAEPTSHQQADQTTERKFND